MSKKAIVAILLSVLVGGGALYFFSARKTDAQKNTAITATTPSPTPAPVKLLTWTDEAGFSFQYPEGTVIDKHPEDNKNYANLTLTLPSKNTVNIIMADNTYKNLDAAVGQNSALDTTLGGVAAKKFLKDGQETIVCIDNGVLVTITGQDITSVVNSWTFIYPSPTTTKSAPATNDGGNVLEEE